MQKRDEIKTFPGTLFSHIQMEHKDTWTGGLTIQE